MSLINIIALFLIILLLGTRLAVVIWARHLIRPIKELQPVEYGIVFGAGLEKTGIPSKVLLERIQTAVLLYQTGKISKIFMTGDNRDQYYNEPEAMRLTANSLGVPAADILTDPDGQRSINSCRNALERFNISEALLVTQKFHLPRVILTARCLGMSAWGIAADHEKHRIDDVVWWHIREIPATFKAVLEVSIYKLKSSLTRQKSSRADKED